MEASNAVIGNAHDPHDPHDSGDAYDAHGLPSVLVLGGGPDAEREVSLHSAAAVAAALRAAGAEVYARTIDRPSAAELHDMPGEVVFPVLHGGFGEGGPLQDMLEADGRPYVGSGPAAARYAMDKVATKAAALRMGLHTGEFALLNPSDCECPLGLPVVVKPVHDGSSVGLHVCRTAGEWARAISEAASDLRRTPGRAYMVERLIAGRELTVPLLGRTDGLRALPLIEIVAACGVYDYSAKYERDDTEYRVRPDLPAGVAAATARQSERLCAELGVRHLARVDYMLDAAGEAWLLEINTMPGFTEHSLVPMAAKASGLELPALCSSLVGMAQESWMGAAGPPSRRRRGAVSKPAPRA